MTPREPPPGPAAPAAARPQGAAVPAGGPAPEAGRPPAGPDAAEAPPPAARPRRGGARSGRGPWPLRLHGVALVLLALAAGAAAAWAWAWSDAAWDARLARARTAGVQLYHALDAGGTPPVGLALSDPLPDGAPAADPALPFATEISFLSLGPGAIGGDRLRLRVLSAELSYPVSSIAGDEAAGGPAAALGAFSALLARWCAEPRVFARLGDGPWRRVEGEAIWGCADAPPDLRAPAALGLVLAAALLLGRWSAISAEFRAAAAALRTRRDEHAPIHPRGPAELREVIAAVNRRLAEERERLEKRALVLSGVSHDLGAPATRLRLRAALIEDAELRGKLERDLDEMTGMLDSVLAFTRAEMGEEARRSLSLTALVEAVVADYADLGRPVTLAAPPPRPGGPVGTLFLAARAPEPPGARVVIEARPLALRRALGNLIDNALKYGRRAEVSLEADAAAARIAVTDEGGPAADPAAMEALVAPFARGPNAAAARGAGLGLSIAAAIARQHGGALSFETAPAGLRAVLTLPRG
ncbi:Signal transduction histidine kinase [Albimonas pacifica]|uniref:histidine kinase n=1 Tax=Albimonas pacifica TaxID=1114924 RepID=A0A1I3NHY9_9RHOB|nr:Signal transduction histidine kinase [Albimonas pacifica]